MSAKETNNVLQSICLDRQAFVAVAAVCLCPKPAQPTEIDPVDQGVPGSRSGIPTRPPSHAHLPRSPLRLNKIDYKDAGNRPGKLTVAGVALPGKKLSRP